jgi:ABC-2 type transport system permease protein
MRKFLAVTKREYKKVVFSWAFLIGTLLAPLIASLFAIVPMMIFSIKSDPIRLVIADQTGKVATRLRENLSPDKFTEKSREAVNNAFGQTSQSQEEKIKESARQLGDGFIFVDYQWDDQTVEQIQAQLSERIKQDQLDAYLIIPPDFGSPGAKFEFFSRNSGDFIAKETLQDALNEAVLSERLSEANISEARLKELSREVRLDVTKVSERGEEKDDGGTFGASFIIGLLIYLTLAIYGQAILGAIVEEKETRIAEILFSSAKPFELMMGKLVGVGLAGLTQLAIWIFSALALITFGLSSFKAAGMPVTMPNISPLMIASFFIFFLLGFFIYATIYALIGSMVTNVQEGGQFSMIPVIILLMAFYCFLPITRDPNSTFAFWASVAPFLAPITMPVRILTEMPPLWQILLAILFNLTAIIGLVWVASRVYRVGMLMYGKRATIPEVWKWIRQS